jgi:hypothetical protein
VQFLLLFVLQTVVSVSLSKSWSAHSCSSWAVPSPRANTHRPATCQSGSRLPPPLGNSQSPWTDPRRTTCTSAKPRYRRILFVFEPWLADLTTTSVSVLPIKVRSLTKPESMAISTYAPAQTSSCLVAMRSNPVAPGVVLIDGSGEPREVGHRWHPDHSESPCSS